MSKTFTFGIVRKMDMVEVLNANNIYQGIKGLDYLFWMLDNSVTDTIKEEIEFCLKNYAGEYIVSFSKKYRGKTIKEIDNIDPYYLEEFLNHKDREPSIQRIAEYYLKYCRTEGSSISLKGDAYRKIAYLTHQINKNSSHDIAIAVYSVFKDILNINIFEQCPSCGLAKNNRWQGIIKRDKENNPYLECKGCGYNIEIMSFLCHYLQMSKKEVVYKIAQYLGVDTDVKDLDETDILDIKETTDKKGDCIFLQYKEMKPTDLGTLGLEKCKATAKFFKDAKLSNYYIERFQLMYAGDNADDYLRGRVCFPVKDENGQVIGVMGKNVISKEQHYKNELAKRKFIEGVTYEQKLQVIDRTTPYTEYKTNIGFNKSFALYNIDKAAKSNLNRLFIWNSPDEVISMVKEFNHEKAVSIMQDVLSKGQLYLLYKHFKDERGKLKIYLPLKDGEPNSSEYVKENAMKLAEIGFKHIYIFHIEDYKSSFLLEFLYSKVNRVDITDISKKEIWLENLGTEEKILLEDKNYAIIEEKQKRYKGFLEDLLE